MDVSIEMNEIYLKRYYAYICTYTYIQGVFIEAYIFYFK